MRIAITLLVFGLISIPPVFGGDLASDLTISANGNPTANAGEPFEAKIKVYDQANPNGMLHFHAMHEKPMHLIIVSDDLKTFAHVHPGQISEHMGKFTIGLNQPGLDPDNLDAIRAVPEAGRYYLYNETMPMGFSMTTLSQELKTSGVPREPEPLVLDPLTEDGAILKAVDDYQIKVVVEPFYHCNALTLELTVHFQQVDPATGDAKDVNNLEPWLSSFSHAVMISEAGNSAAEKKFYHIHAVYPLPDDPNGPKGPLVRLGLHNHSPLAEGVYKTWLQFKHNDGVHTLPLTFALKAPPPEFPLARSSRSIESELCISP
jgi:hypothetical protein